MINTQIQTDKFIAGSLIKVLLVDFSIIRKLILLYSHIDVRSKHLPADYLRKLK